MVPNELGRKHPLLRETDANLPSDRSSDRFPGISGILVVTGMLERHM